MPIHGQTVHQDAGVTSIYSYVYILQENVPEGDTPQTVSLMAYDDNVDSVKPGDRITVTGVYRA